MRISTSSGSSTIAFLTTIGILAAQSFSSHENGPDKTDQHQNLP